MARFGSIEQYLPGTDFEDYIDRLEQFFAANDVPLVNDPSAEQVVKQRGIFLSSIGAETYTLLKDLMAPTKPKDKTYIQLKETLLGHLKPKRLVIAERFRFHSRKQKEQETVTQFAAAISHLATTCEFIGASLQEMLRDRFVCGLRSNTTQKKLLTEENLTFDKAVKIAVSYERAEYDTAELQVTSGATAESLPVHKTATDTSAASGGALCFRCGRRGHEPSQCRFLNATCYECQRTGHIAPVCRSKKKKPSGKFGSRPRVPSQKTHQVEERSGDEETEECGQIMSVKVRSRDSQGELAGSSKKTGRGPMLVKVRIQGRDKVMELDTGSARSLMSIKEFEGLHAGVALEKTRVKLQTFTGEQIEIKGEAKVQIEHNGQSLKLPLMVVADHGAPSLLGRDWLEVLRLDWNKVQKVRCFQDERLSQILEENATLFADSLGTMQGVKAKLQLCREAVPKFLKARPVPYALRAAVETELDRLERQGIVEKTRFSSWGTPLVCIPKRDGDVRLCGDYKMTVNPQLEVDQYPIPTPEELFTAVAGGQKFSRLDLANAYQQMELDEDSREMVTLHTHRGLYRYRRLPFGIASAPAIFQQAMEQVLVGLDHVVVYLDDILVTGTSTDDHLKKLSEVFKRLAAVGLRLKKGKCEFLLDEVEYLGFKISQQGISPSESKVEAIRNAPEPQNQTQLRAFLGLVNYHRKFVPELATLLEPLNRLLCQGQKSHWDRLPTEAEHAFQRVKQKLARAPCLDHFRAEIPLVLAADASQYGIGAVLMHRYQDGSERPIAYASRTLSKAERNYAQVEKEALALIFGVTKFHLYLYGRHFTLVTDHQPLLKILGPKSAVPALAAARLQRWAVVLSAYTYDIGFKGSKENVCADALSRLPLAEEDSSRYRTADLEGESSFMVNQIHSLPVTAERIADETKRDTVLKQVKDYTLSGWPAKVTNSSLIPFFHKRQELTVEQGCLLWGGRVLIPDTCREAVLNELHAEHIGICRMKAVARGLVWWPGLDKALTRKAGDCMECGMTQKKPVSSPLHSWVYPSGPWERVHIDFAQYGPDHYLVVIDAFSKWPEVIHMGATTTAAATIAVLRRVFSTHGLPRLIVSDNGPQFHSEDFTRFLSENGIRHKTIPPYHPATNGLAERLVQELKQSLKRNTVSAHPVPKQHLLANFLLAYRTTPHSTTGTTPAELLFKRKIRTRLDLLKPSFVDDMRDKQVWEEGTQRQPLRHMEPGAQVWVYNCRDKFRLKWEAGTVLQRLGPLSYIVSVQGSNRHVHIDHIKKRSGTLGEALLTMGPVRGETPQQKDPGPVIEEQTEEGAEESAGDTSDLSARNTSDRPVEGPCEPASISIPVVETSSDIPSQEPPGGEETPGLTAPMQVSRYPKRKHQKPLRFREN